MYSPQNKQCTDFPDKSWDGAETNSKTNECGTQESKRYGFATRKCQWCQSSLKGNVLDRPSFFQKRPQRTGGKIKIVHYICIAADEEKRIERHINDETKVLPLVQIGWDEDLCGLEAQYLDMLSPTYDNSSRDGCWFCHNQSVDQLRLLRKNYPDLWKKLLTIDKDSPVTFHADGHTVNDFDKRFKMEEQHLVPKDRTFKWSMLDGPVQITMFTTFDEETDE